MFEKDILVEITTQSGAKAQANGDKTISRTYTSNTATTNDISIGFAGASGFDISLDNIDAQWDNTMLKKAVLEPVISGEGITKALGSFDVEVSQKEQGAINITAIDKMVVFDVKFLGATFPCTVGHLVDVICNQVGVVLATPAFTNSEFSIKSGERLKGASCRNILVLCCELSCTFARINAAGQLELKWYDFNDIKTTYAYEDLKAFKADETPTQITGVEFWQGEDHFLSGNDGLTLSITDDNALLEGADTATIQGVLDAIYTEKLKLMNYLPCTFTTPVYRPFDAGDVIKITTEKGQTYLVIVTELKIVDNLEVHVTCTGKAKAEVKRYTQGVKSPGQSDPGDKIGFVLGYNTAAYTFTESAQTVAACALGLDVETRVDVQLVGTYEFTPAAPSTLSVVGDVTGTTQENITGTINSSDPTKITGTATGTMTGELTGTGTLTDASPPLVTIEYRVNGVTQMTFYQYPHPGMNTFSAAFIPSAQKPGTASIDMRFTISGGTIAFEKREANISLLVKNGDVVDTPPWPEINISQVFSPIVIEDNGELITIAELSENVITSVQMPVGGLIQEVFEGIAIEDSEPIQVGVFNDTLLIDRVIGGEIFRFNTQYADMYNYSTKYIVVSADNFKEQDTYKFVGVEKPIDTGLMVEVAVQTDEFKNVNSIEVEVK